MMRGDDVAELQQNLGALGFDAGRVDGIFGDATATAVSDFQRNTGLPEDGIVGSTTLFELARVRARERGSEVVSAVMAREQLRRAPPTLAGRHIAVGEAGGLATAVRALRRRLVLAGARVTPLHHPDDSVRAAQANTADVNAYVGLQLNATRSGCTTWFYGNDRYESPGGRSLAELVQREVPRALGLPDGGIRAMTVPVLRETRMPAVLVELGPALAVVEHGAALADALVAALSRWASADWS
ncbi:MAG: peptidoglycan-binding protein [Actinomycetota bacterium]|jgi:N-acetylmuramoyl-L-alanine amidase|nr:peptidoglycan-binding protein [Actinomycetota bacterium]